MPGREGALSLVTTTYPTFPGKFGKLSLHPDLLKNTLGLLHSVTDQNFIDFSPTTVYLHRMFLLPRMLSSIFLPRKFIFFFLKTSWKVSSSLRPFRRKLAAPFPSFPLKCNLAILISHHHLSVYTCVCPKARLTPQLSWYPSNLANCLILYKYLLSGW